MPMNPEIVAKHEAKREGDLRSNIAGFGVGLGAGIAGTMLGGPALGLLGASVVGGAIGGAADRLTYHAMEGDLDESWRDVLESAGWGAGFGLVGGAISQKLAGRAATKAIKNIERMTSGDYQTLGVGTVDGGIAAKANEIGFRNVSDVKEMFRGAAGQVGSVKRKDIDVEKLTELVEGLKKREVRKVGKVQAQELGKQLRAKARANKPLSKDAAEDEYFKALLNQFPVPAADVPSIERLRVANLHTRALMGTEETWKLGAHRKVVETQAKKAAQLAKEFELRWNAFDELDLSPWSAFEAAKVTPKQFRGMLKPGSGALKAFDREFRGKGLVAAWDRFYWKGIAPIKEYLTRRVDKFGATGAIFNGQTEQFYGTWKTIDAERRAILEPLANKIVSIRGGEKAFFQKVMYNNDEFLRAISNPKDRAFLDEAVSAWQTYTDAVADELVANGVRMKDEHLAHWLTFNKARAPLMVKAVRRYLQSGQEDDSLLKKLNIAQRKTADEQINRFLDLGGKFVRNGTNWTPLVPFQKRQLYAPMYYKAGFYNKLMNKDVATIAQSRAYVKKQMEEALIKKGTPPDQMAKFLSDEHVDRVYEGLVHEAEVFLPREIRGHNVQFSRGEFALSPELVTNPREWMLRYNHDATRRIAAAAVWGGSDEKFEQLVSSLGGSKPKKVQLDSTASQELNQIFNALTGRRKPLPEWAKVLNTGSTVMMLGPRTSAIQALQINAPTAFFGYLNTAKGLSALARQNQPAFKRLIQQSGILLPDVQQDFAQDINRLGERWLQLPLLTGPIPMTKMDGAMRVISAFSGMFKAMDDLDELAKMGANAVRGNKKVDRLWGSLQKLGFTDEELRNVNSWYAQGNILEREKAVRTMRAAARLTQFESNVNDLPLYRTGQWGPFLYKFKTFALQQNAMVFDMYKMARVGNIGPLSRFAATTGVLGIGTVGAAIQALTTNPDMPDKDKFDKVKLVMNYGTLGIMSDAMYAAYASAKDDRPGAPSVANYAITPNAKVGFDIASGAFKIPYWTWGLTTGAMDHEEYWKRLYRQVSPNTAKQYWNMYRNLKELYEDN